MATRPKTQTCYRCGMKKESWKGDRGKGVKKNGAMYCCQGCADDTGCTCGD